MASSISTLAAWLQTSCEAAPNPLQCRLDSWLHLLSLICVGLGILLVLVAGFAIAAYLRNRRTKLSSRSHPPKDLSA